MKALHLQKGHRSEHTDRLRTEHDNGMAKAAWTKNISFLLAPRPDNLCGVVNCKTLKP